ncbi:3-oxoacyl-[acyl-carrier protein] reductase [Amycolatopsis xylanica]|uniref:3-oxoacyl-[acyl-carrier protein] reductase n=1 Tax=Amycolatopsis xylanica TaxID=589385 RepID=A0A1H3DUG5_9PSEU|nr:SDR family NAD(P)-dependent oxidoreductase [Amycolatopsis xylanica]SDX70011.1 3-oxoacyl-[acyl-carrier protein] reductase [Amycolatopsis xylanica]
METRLAGTDQVALVTGGARGIGSALCERLAEEGAMVAVNYRSDAASAQALVDRLRASGARAVMVKADLCEPEQAERAVRQTAEAFGSEVSILVNNVGEFVLGAVAETSALRWKAIIDSNLNSAFYATKAALPGMRSRGFGRVITIGLAPALDVRGAPNLAAYTVAKTGIAVLTRSLATEEARHGITVNCVAPGLIDNGHLPPEQAGWMAKRVPAGRLGTSGDIADAVAFLVSDRAGYISGATLSVSGGWDWGDRPVDHDADVTELFAEAANV